MTYETLVVDATLYKLEALYAKVAGDERVGDYSHIALGVEHTLENIYEGAALGLIAEYYRYDTYEAGKLDDLALFESMQNDLFVGARYSFNNANNSSFIGGAIVDMEYQEQVYYMEFESRVAESFTLALDYYSIEPSTTDATPYAQLGNHQRVGIKLAYYF